MYTRIKSTMTGLAASTVAIMLSYAFGGAPNPPSPFHATMPAEMVIISLSSDVGNNDQADANPSQGQTDRRHMSRVLATPYLSVGRLLPRRGS